MNVDGNYVYFMNDFKKYNDGSRSEIEAFLLAFKRFQIQDFKEDSLKRIVDKIQSLILFNEEELLKKRVLMGVVGVFSVLSLAIPVNIVGILGVASGSITIGKLGISTNKSKQGGEALDALLDKAKNSLDFRDKKRKAKDVSYINVIDEVNLKDRTYSLSDLIRAIMKILGEMPTEFRKTYDLKLSMLFIKYGKNLELDRNRAYQELLGILDDVLLYRGVNVTQDRTRERVKSC